MVDLSYSGFSQIAETPSEGVVDVTISLVTALRAPTLLQPAAEARACGPSRALGQNFVADPNTVRRIARLAEVGPESSVLEFGAGLGSLTLALAETGARVVAVELDRYILPVLRTVAGARWAPKWWKAMP